MRWLLILIFFFTVSCNTVKYPLVPISKEYKKRIYSLTKDTLDKRWMDGDKYQKWEVISIQKYVSNIYEIRTQKIRPVLGGHFIIVSLDSSLQIKYVGEEWINR